MHFDYNFTSSNNIQIPLNTVIHVIIKTEQILSRAMCNIFHTQAVTKRNKVKKVFAKCTEKK